jgi:hypothetical protein
LNKIFNVTKLPDLTDDFKIQGAIDRLLELARLSVGSRGKQNWIDHIRTTGTLLACLTDEEYETVCRSFKDQRLTAKQRRVIVRTQPEESPSLERYKSKDGREF